MNRLNHRDHRDHREVIRVSLCALCVLSGSLFAFCPTAQAAEVWSFKREFLPALVKAVPGILQSQDKATGRFGTGVFIVTDQNAMYSLAVAWNTPPADGVENRY